MFFLLLIFNSLWRYQQLCLTRSLRSKRTKSFKSTASRDKNFTEYNRNPKLISLFFYTKTVILSQVLRSKLVARFSV
jgi:hypothetical protein